MSEAISRRTLVRGASTAAVAVVAAPFLNLGRYRLFASSEREYTRRCVDLVQSSLVIDMLGPTTLNGDTFERWGPDYSGLTDEDIAEFRASEIDVLHIAVGVGGSTTEQAYRRDPALQIDRAGGPRRRRRSRGSGLSRVRR